MWTMLIVVAVLAAGGLLVARMVLAGRRPAHDAQAEPVDAESASDDFPAPGEPSPHRSDGRPIPGSRDDRREHGQT